MNEHLKKRMKTNTPLIRSGLLKTVKLFLISALFASQTFAVNVSAQSVNVKMAMRNTTVAGVIEELHKQTGYEFSYDAEILSEKLTNVSVNVKNERIETVLSRIFEKSNVSFRVLNNRVFLKSNKAPESITPTEPRTVQQGKTVTGTIIDANGEPVIGATVVVQGDASKGTVTDMDGNYTLTGVPDNAILVVSYVGMRTQNIPLARRTSVNVTMAEDTELLDEVVVVGYTTQRRESLTGALQTISNKKLKDITTPSVENMLNGKAPGVFVAPGSGQPGQAGTIVIRGKSTVNGSTDPLWVIDGVIVGNTSGSLNPADIETMTILKDAASTAIYGSQGANGVIVVTTKNPRADKISVTLSAKAGVTSLHKGNLQMMNGTELYDYFKSFSNQQEIVFGRWNENLRNDNFSWWNLAAQTGVAQDYNLTISGGTQQLKSMFSLGAYNETGAVKGYDFARYNFLYKTDFRPIDWLSIKPIISGALRNIDDKQYSVSTMYSGLPWDSPYDKNGIIVKDGKEGNWVNTTGVNYLYDLQWNFSKSKIYEFMGGIDFDIKLTDYLTFASVNNFKWNGIANSSYGDPRSSGAIGVSGRLIEEQADISRRYTNQLLRFNKAFGNLHFVNAVIGYEFNNYRAKTVNAQGTGFVPGLQVLDAVAKPESTKGNINEWAVQSYLFNGNYSYDDRYFAQLSLRRDGASNFGDNAKYGNFFSVSGGWNIHKESFFKADWINKSKLRASYGTVGNRPTALYPQYDLYSTQSYNEIPGVLISQVGNRDLTWEKTITAGVGFEATFLDRVRLTLDYYEKNTDNLLYEVPISGLTGVTKIWKNVGEVKNRGFETTLGVDLIKNKDLLWNFDFNLGLNHNKVTALYGEQAQIIIADGAGISGSANKLLKPGLDADSWYIREWAGVDPETGAAQWYKTVKAADGKETREVTNKYAEADLVVMGAYTPNFFGGFSTGLYWKQFDFNAVFGYFVGGKIYNYSRLEYDSDGAYTDRNQMKLMSEWSRWQKPGDIATHPKASYNNTANPNSNKASSRFLEDGSYLKLRSLSFGYNVALAKYKISNVRFSLTGENLFTVTKYSGVDPEIPPNTNTRRITGVNITPYPSTRKFLIGVELTF